MVSNLHNSYLYLRSIQVTSQVHFPSHWLFERQIRTEARPPHYNDWKPSVGLGVSPSPLSSHCHSLRVQMVAIHLLCVVYAVARHWRSQRRERPTSYVSLPDLSRGCDLIVGGSAILSDVTTPETRAKALAHVGIAFAICFCIGPPIGAYFASRPLPTSFTASGFELNVYAGPAALTLALLILETIFLIFALPETRGKATQKASPNGSRKVAVNGKANGTTQTSRHGTVAERLTMLKSLQRLHFLFLGVFSGVEFTLTFLTFDRKSSNINCHSDVSSH